MREGEELQHQTEEDADREILSLKNRYERQLRERLEENTRLRGELGIHTKKVRLQSTSTVIQSLNKCQLECRAKVQSSSQIGRVHIVY